MHKVSRRVALKSAVGLAFWSGGATLNTPAYASVGYSVPGSVSPVDQGVSDLCWLASTAMLLSWKRNISLSMQQVAAELGSRFVSLYNARMGLPPDLIDTFIATAGLGAEPGLSRTAVSWEAVLRNRGALAVGIDDRTPDNRMAHLVVMTGIAGDESLTGTKIEIIDPNGGLRKSLTFKQFLAVFEADDPVDTKFNVFYVA